VVDLDQTIAEELGKVEESFMYLGVLKNTPLMEAMQAFDNAFQRVVDLYADLWGKNGKEEYPSRDRLFIALGEDYDKIKGLIHGNEALDPIYSGLRHVHDYLLKLRDEGMSWEEGKERLIGINESRKG